MKQAENNLGATDGSTVQAIYLEMRALAVSQPQPDVAAQAEPPADALVERLEQAALSGDSGYAIDAELVQEAAARLAALREELRKANIDAANMMAECSDLSVDIEKYRSEGAKARAERDDAQRSGVTHANYWMDRAERAEAALAEAQADAERWIALCNLWMASTILTLTQDEDGRWSIGQTEPVDSETFATLTGDTPDAAIDAARSGGKG